MKLNDDVVIALNGGNFKTIKGYIIPNNPNYAITNEIDNTTKEITKGSYCMIHIPSGFRCSNKHYNSITELLADKEQIITNAETILHRAQENKWINEYIEKMNEYKGIKKPVIEDLMEFSDVYKESIAYAQLKRSKSKLCRCMDMAIKADKTEHGFTTEQSLFNGSIMCNNDGSPYMYSCIIGDGYVDDGRTWFLSNMYEINFYSGCKGCTIYKSNNISLHYKCFVCGNSPEIFGYNHFSKGCRVFEELTVDEILQKLVNKNWGTYGNINKKSKYNKEFLRLMKQRLIKSLKHNKVIHWCDEQNKYIDYDIYKYFYKK